MKIGPLTNIWREGDPTAGEIRALRDSGLAEWVEFRLPRSIHPLPERMKDAVASAALEVGLPLSLHCEATTFVLHRTEAVRRQVQQTLDDVVRLAHAIGASVVTVHPPMALAADPEECPRGTGSRAGWTEEDLGLLRETVQGTKEARELFWLALYGPSAWGRYRGVTLAIENMRPHAHDLGLNGVHDLAQFLHEECLDEVGLCLDVRKVLGEGLDVGAAIAAHGRRLASVHVSGSGARGEPAPVEDGALDWPGVFQALCETGYTGPVIYEGPPRATPESLRVLHRARDQAEVAP